MSETSFDSADFDSTAFDSTAGGLGSDGTGDVLDLDQALGDDEVDAELDTSWSPPERPHGVESFGTTADEALQGESLDQRLAQEEPDPSARLVLDAAPDVDPDTGLPIGDDDGLLDDGEVGDVRAGRLVDPDQGGSGDDESELVGTEVGIDGGAASAEEAAVHIVEP